MSGVPNWRFYTVAIAMGLVGWTTGYFHGKNTTERKEAELSAEITSRVADVHTEKYSNMPRSRSGSIKFLFEHANKN